MKISWVSMVVAPTVDTSVGMDLASLGISVMSSAGMHASASGNPGSLGVS